MRKPNNRKKLYLAIFIIAVMVLSTFGFIASFNSSNQDDFDYNGFSFRRTNDLWTTKINDKEFTFLFHPLDLTVEVPSGLTDALKQAPTITLIFDPNSTSLQYIDVARFELNQVLAIDLGKNVQNAVTSATDAYDLQVASCTPQPDHVYITFTESNESSASINGNCITLTTDNPVEYVEYSEKIIYTLLGVMQNG